MFLTNVKERVRGIATDGIFGADSHLIDALPNLEIVACYGVGVDAIDVSNARARGIVVTNTPDVLTDDVADMAIGLMLAVVRRICVGDRFIRRGDWLKKRMPLTPSLGGKRCGILGLGRIGKAVAKRLEGFGTNICYHGLREQIDQPYPYYHNLVEMARDCDVLFITCRGGEPTRNIVNKPVLEALGPEGVLINVARGSVVDEQALIATLTEGRLGGAGLDVFADEPRVPDPLLVMENVVLQPHQASAAERSHVAMSELVIANLRAHFAGQPALTPVTPT